MAHFAFAVLFGSVGEDSNLFALAVFDNFTGNLCALYNRGAYYQAIFLADSKNLELYVLLFLSVHLLNENDVAYRYAILFAAGFDNCVHN